MANMADNIIRVYVDTEEEDFITVEQIKDDLEALSYEYFDVDFMETDMLSINMGSRWNAPVDEFQEICNRYGCHIIGVSYEFGNGYVDAFDLHSEVSNEIEDENHYVAVVATDEVIEQTLPILGDENYL